jgi:hypothetical protein
MAKYERNGVAQKTKRNGGESLSAKGENGWRRWRSISK